MPYSDRDRQEAVEQNTDNAGTELAECLVCGAVGLPERIRDHDCRTFLEER